MPDGSADALVTDPPAGIEFMGSEWDTFRQGRLKKYRKQPGGSIADAETGKSFPTRRGTKHPCLGQHANPRCVACGKYQWDHVGRKCECASPDWQVDNSARQTFVGWLTVIMAECLRVLKPGGYALVWALPRTSHWTATALEDAGFEIRDVITHLFGQGFPKGKGCLKPAAENWILCRRPGPRVLPLNIEECRIPIVGPVDPHRQGYSTPGKGASRNCYALPGNGQAAEVPHPDSPRHDARGRYPANLCLSHHPLCVCRGTKRVRGSHDGGKSLPCGGAGYGEGWSGRAEGLGYAGPDGTEEVEDWACHPECPVFLLDGQAGASVSRQAERGAGLTYSKRRGPEGVRGFDDSGGVSRFFYVAKADRADRGEGNDHPCTKSTALMQWLVKLVSRPGETVLDPFCGSGSTGVAALRCERRFVGVERDAHYHAIALKRLADVDGPLFARPAGEAAP
jgi:DNA modification methylase